MLIGRGDNYGLGTHTGLYPSSVLADRKQARMEFWKNGFMLKQCNAPKAIAGVPEESQP